MERHYIKDLIKSMFRLDADGNSCGNAGNSSEDLLSISYSTDDEADIADISKKSNLNKSKCVNDGAHHSPEPMALPRSVKEVEESHASLKKENFNLKLRIYFLEERMNTDFNINPDNAVMKNIELKVQVESLRKELAERQEMLCQAVKTMELDEEDYKKLLADRDKKCMDLDKEYQSLQRKYEMIQQDQERSHGDINLPDPEKYYHSFDLEANILDLENKLGEEQSENTRLKNIFDEEIRSHDLKVSCLQAEIEEKTSIVTEQLKRIVSLESNNEKRYLEVQRLKEERCEDNKRIADLESSLRESQQAMETIEQAYEHETIKVNRSKLSLSQRNKRIMELEDIVRRQKTHIGTLEAQVRPQQQNYRSSPQTLGATASSVSISSQCAAAFSALSGEPPNSPTSQNLSVNNNSSNNNIENVYNNNDQRLSECFTTTTPNQTATDDDDKKTANAETSDDPKVLQKELVDSRHYVLKLEKDRRRAGEIIHSMLEKRKELQNEISKLKVDQLVKDKQIGKLKRAVHDLQDPINVPGNVSSLAKSIPKSSSVQSSSEEVNSQSTFFDDTDINILCAKYQTLANDLDTQKELLREIIKEKDAQMDKLELDYNIALTDMKIKDDRITDLENRVVRGGNGGEKLDVGSEKHQHPSTSSSFWIIESEEKDREIDRLETELRQRNVDIQTLVNKELWEKNREISKLQQLVQLKDTELAKICAEMDLLKAELNVLATRESTPTSPDDVQMKLRNSIEDRKKLLEQIELLYVDNSEESHKDYLHLKNEYKQLKDEFERSERLREQTNDICTVLSNRLEELAVFLDSLLKQKSLLGFLGNKKNCKLRQIIDQSLDLSRTLNMNLSQMNADQSLLQLTNISNFLNSAIINDEGQKEEGGDGGQKEEGDDDDDNDEKDQIIEEQTRIIHVLRQQLDKLKKNELLHSNSSKHQKNETVDYDESVVNILLDISKMDEAATKVAVLSPQMILENLMSDKLTIQQNEQILNNTRTTTTTTSTTLKYWQESNSTESESWSEPDRNVSKQRIGLDASNLLNAAAATVVKATTSDDETNTAAGVEDVDHRKVKAKRSSLLVLENKQLQEEVRELKEKITAKSDILLQTEQSFCIITDQLKKELKILDTLRLENQQLLAKITTKENDLQSCESVRIANQQQIFDLHKVIDHLHEQQAELKANAHVKTKEQSDRINQLEQERTQTLCKSAETVEENKKLAGIIQNYEVNLKELYREKMHLEGALRHESELIEKQAEEFRVEVVKLKEQSENEVKRITETALTMKQRYESEYVKRAELDKMMSSIKELESLQMVLSTTEEKIQLLEENEATLKVTLKETHREYREKLNDLRKELDLSTLKYSEIMLEKTRQMKEKAALEVQIKEYANKEEDFKRQVADFQESLNSMKLVFQSQVANLTGQKSALELKLHEAESINEELRRHNNVRGEPPRTSTSAPTTPSKFFSLFLGRQFSYTNQIEEFPPNHHHQHHRSSITNQSGGDGSLLSNSEHNDHVVVLNNENIPEYNMEDCENRAMAVGGNTSPDLGIESDQGRFSSLENNNTTNTNSQQRPFFNTLELSQQMQNLLLSDEQQQTVGIVEGMTSSNLKSPRSEKNACKRSSDNGRCLNVLAENSQLREKLLKTRSALEETVSQLKYANDKKKHVEKTICKQIHKTSQVLRKAKANLDSGSETDLRRK